jgi:hypothetical protein
MTLEKQGMMVHTCNHSTREVEERGSQVLGQTVYQDSVSKNQRLGNVTQW